MQTDSDLLTLLLLFSIIMKLRLKQFLDYQKNIISYLLNLFIKSLFYYFKSLQHFIWCSRVIFYYGLCFFWILWPSH